MVEQRTHEWFTRRAGNITASRIKDLMAKGRGGQESASRKNYRAQLVAERITNQYQESFTSSAMQRGIELEDNAKACFEFATGLKIEPVAYVPHPTIDHCGASPDGLILDTHVFEAKCPNTATHIEYITEQKVPRDYFWQMQWQMACAVREAAWFASYDPRLGVDLQLFKIEVLRCPDTISEIEAEAVKMLAEVDAILIKLMERIG